MDSEVSPVPGILTKAIAGVLRARRAKYELSQNDLAEAADVSQAQLSKILAGRKDIPIRMLDQLCYALGVKGSDVLAEAEAETAFRQAKKDWPAKSLVHG